MNARFFFAPVSLSTFNGIYATIDVICLRASSCVIYLLASIIDACKESNNSLFNGFSTSKRIYPAISLSDITPNALNKTNNSIGCFIRGIEI